MRSVVTRYWKIVCALLVLDAIIAAYTLPRIINRAKTEILQPMNYIDWTPLPDKDTPPPCGQFVHPDHRRCR